MSKFLSKILMPRCRDRDMVSNMYHLNLGLYICMLCTQLASSLHLLVQPGLALWILCTFWMRITRVLEFKCQWDCSLLLLFYIKKCQLQRRWAPGDVARATWFRGNFHHSMKDKKSSYVFLGSPIEHQRKPRSSGVALIHVWRNCLPITT
jgi:hypothetical protein